MPGPYVVPVHGNEELPVKVDVVVVGGGIVGCSTALELVDRGYSVAICEKGGIGHEQSSRNWGWVRMTQRDEREIPLMAESLRLWANLDKRTGRTTGYSRCGVVFSTKTPEELEKYRGWLKKLEPYQLESRIVGKKELEELYPGNKANIAGAVYSPFDGRAEPQRAAPAIAEAARDKGAAILTECAVRGFETSGGKISAAVTERGTIKCDAVVLAGGAWSNLFANRYGLDLPQLTVMGTVLRTAPLDGPEQSYWGDRFGFRRRLDGGYNVGGYQTRVDIVPNSFKYFTLFRQAAGMVPLSFNIGTRFFQELSTPKHWAMDEASPFEYHRVLDPKPLKNQQAVLDTVAESFPFLRDAKIAQTWAGYIDVTPDAVPVLSGVESVPGFYIATGMSGHGFGLGPGAGLLMADLVSGRAPSVDPKPYRFSRFSDGSPVMADRTF